MPSVAASPSIRARGRQTLKGLVECLTLVLVLPLFGVYWIARRVLGPEVFPAWSQALALVPGLSGSYLRQTFYRLSLAHCGTGVRISFGTVLTSEQAEFGDRVYVGIGAILGAVRIADDVLIASGVSVLNGARQHGIERTDRPIRDQDGHWLRIQVGPGAWIGERAVVMADVGAGSVVGAGAVVTRPVPDLAVVAGVPARLLRRRTDGLGSPAADVPRPGDVEVEPMR